MVRSCPSLRMFRQDVKNIPGVTHQHVIADGCWTVATLFNRTEEEARDVFVVLGGRLDYLSEAA